MQTLKSMHLNKSGKVSDKWSSYIVFYERIFKDLRDQPIKLLEIGVQNGGSLETWAEYFTAGLKFIGCDINPKCAQLKYGDPRISILIGDINTENVYSRIVEELSEIDIIIDDGSHISNDILSTFVNYFSRLKPGGVYIVEDAHTLFMRGYGGGIDNHQGAQNFFHKLADFLSVEFWSGEVILEIFFSDFFQAGRVPDFILEG